MIRKLKFTGLTMFFIFFLCSNGLARKVVKPYTDYPEVKGAPHFVTKTPKCPKGYSYDPKFEIRNVWEKNKPICYKCPPGFTYAKYKDEEKCIRCKPGWIYDGKSKCIKCPCCGFTLKIINGKYMCVK
ncbi:MAG: hypothetical protein OD816_001040 [Thermodesulfobacterium sp.]|uniref:Tyrosine-protein kinase ephrin type A/B receptor-like domain-containing protein n=1 Tax=Candidatus Thermodesulfobacterium syntrophicum TaxID=3060442 RepID=A0AAE3P515_9BACT|nr:hypothetical protein [Candidatus Thermodesulfobacterium syntrophicum]